MAIVRSPTASKAASVTAPRKEPFYRFLCSPTITFIFCLVFFSFTFLDLSIIACCFICPGEVEVSGSGFFSVEVCVWNGLFQVESYILQ